MFACYYLLISFNAVSHAVFASLGNDFPIDPHILAASILADLSSLQAQKAGVVVGTPVSPLPLRLPVVGEGRDRVLFSLTSSVYFEVTIV